MLKLKKTEYLGLKERFEKVSKPGFKLQLQTEIKELKAELKQTKILKRKSDNQQRALTNNLDNLEQVGKPNSLIKLHDLEYDLAVFAEKNKKLEAANENYDKVLDRQKEQMQQCYKKLNERKKEAKQLGIKESAMMKKKFEKIKKQEKALETNTKARDKMFKAKLKQLKRDTDQVLIQYKICEEKE